MTNLIKYIVKKFNELHPFTKILLGVCLLWSMVSTLHPYFFTGSTKMTESQTKEVVKKSEKPVVVKEIFSFNDINLDKISSLEIYDDPFRLKKIVVEEKDSEEVKILKNVNPSILSVWVDKVLMPQNIAFKMKDMAEFPKKYEASEKEQKKQASPTGYYVDAVKGVMQWVGGNFFQIAMLALMAFLIFKVHAGIGSSSIDLHEPEDIKGSWDDLLGMEDIKKEVKNIISLVENKSAYENNGVDQPFNIMFTGPAGTGKSKLAGYFAKELGYPIITAEGSSLETGYVGGGSRALKSIYKRALKLKNCVVFIDEAQSLFMKRGAHSINDSKYADDTPNTFLSILDGVSTKKEGNIIWVVASNFDDSSMEMDEAMLRRFQLKINFRLPNKEERKAILKKYFQVSTDAVESEKQTSLTPPSDELITEMAEYTAELSPAILETIAKKAKVMAISEKTTLTREVLFKSFEQTVIGMSNRENTIELHKTRKTVAEHELGHFFVQLHFSLEDNNQDIEKAFDAMNLLKISTESISKVGALGYVLSKQQDDKLFSRKSLERDIMKLYGGVAAEEVLHGQHGISTGSSDDIEKATKLLTTMVSRLSMYSNTKINYSLLAQEDLAKDKTLKEIEELAESLYLKTLHIVETHKEDIIKLTPILLDKFVMSKQEIKQEYLNLHQKEINNVA